MGTVKQQIIFVMGNQAHKPKEGATHLSGQLTKIPQGILNVKILDAFIEHDTSPFLKMDPTLKLKMTTQKFHTKTLLKSGQTPDFQEQFNFCVNSDSIGEGRVLEIGVWDKGQTFDSEEGYGLVDVDPIIMNKLQNVRQKCYISYNRQPAGYVNIVLSFREELLGVLFIHVLNASIRRKIGVGEMNCVARVIIGEAIETTRPSKDKKDEMPSWDQTFRIPILKSTQEGTLQILDHRMGTDKHVGETQLFISELASSTKQSYHESEIWHKQSDAGLVKFIALFVNLEKVSNSQMEAYLEEVQASLRLREYQILTAESQFRRSAIRKSIKPQIPIQVTFEPITPQQRSQQLPRMIHSQIQNQQSIGQIPKQQIEIQLKPQTQIPIPTIHQTHETKDEPLPKASQQNH